MKRKHEARLRKLEARTTIEGDDNIIFGWTTADDGTVEAYHVLNNGRTYTPAEFDHLIEEHADAVFIPLQTSSALTEAAAAAYWEELESELPSWEELLTENAEVERIRRTGGDLSQARSPRLERMAQRAHVTAAEEEENAGGDEDAWTENVTLDSDRATLARYHAWLMEQSEPFWEEMRRRKKRLAERRPY